MGTGNLFCFSNFFYYNFTVFAKELFNFLLCSFCCTGFFKKIFLSIFTVRFNTVELSVCGVFFCRYKKIVSSNSSSSSSSSLLK